MFKNLKSLFIEEDGKAEKKTEPEEPVAEEQGNNIDIDPIENPDAQEGPSVKAPSQGKVNLKFMEILFKAMQDNNLDGFDYLEFKQSLKSLEKMPMDEQTRFQSAFAMAQTMGASPANLIQSANHYLNVLKKEEQKFSEVVANQRTKQIGDKERQYEQYEKAINVKKEKIKNLTKEIEQHQQIMSRLKNEITEATVKVESTKNDFHVSYKKVISAINKDVESMKRFLK